MLRYDDVDDVDIMVNEGRLVVEASGAGAGWCFGLMGWDERDGSDGVADPIEARLRGACTSWTSSSRALSSSSEITYDLDDRFTAPPMRDGAGSILQQSDSGGVREKREKERNRNKYRYEGGLDGGIAHAGSPVDDPDDLIGGCGSHFGCDGGGCDANPPRVLEG